MVRRPSGIQRRVAPSAVRAITGRADEPATGTHVYHVDVSPDGALIATASDESVKVWDAATRR